MILNNNEIAAVKDCLKRYIAFNNNGMMSSYKVKQSSLILMDERDIDIDYKKMIVLKENKPVYRIIERYSNKMTKKEYCLSHDHIAYYSGAGGVEIHGIEGDYIYCTSSTWCPPKKYHKVPLNECIRFGTMWA